jgi:hypothetical protein
MSRIIYISLFLVGMFFQWCSLSAQSSISAVIPDICSPGMNVAMEILAPASEKGAFGTDGIYLWGAQLEAGSVATSYIATGATSATRQPDLSNTTAALFGSDWAMVTVGLFGAPDVVVDPYTKADTGQVKITLNQFADVAHRQPATTSKIEDLLAG